MQVGSIVMLLVVLSATVTGEAESMENFVPDERVHKIATAYSLDAVDTAKQNFGVELDWSVESIREVEKILARLHEAMNDEAPSDETLQTFAKIFGSYLGEVVRREHGGQWGLLGAEGEATPGMSHGIWPWDRAYKRITLGPDENVWHYYQLIFRIDELKPLDLGGAKE